jgi:hypothetical protein
VTSCISFTYASEEQAAYILRAEEYHLVWRKLVPPKRLNISKGLQGVALHNHRQRTEILQSDRSVICVSLYQFGKCTVHRYIELLLASIV